MTDVTRTNDRVHSNHNDEREMRSQEVLAACIHMHTKARRFQGVAKRISYTQQERETAIGVLSVILRNGGTRFIAADMMGMNVGTLMNWYDKATAPGTEWVVNHYKMVTTKIPDIP